MSGWRGREDVDYRLPDVAEEERRRARMRETIERTAARGASDDVRRTGWRGRWRERMLVIAVVVGTAVVGWRALRAVTVPADPTPQTLVCQSGGIEVEWRNGDAHVACVVYAHSRRAPAVLWYDPHGHAEIVHAIDPLR